ncbi:putative sodium/metabolite cotransporter BASS4 [Hibiscus syriacus]|uniref:Sodium/metabolite cotransporter BASS4 n=1 Tax=Hibiscus syriacus TaxID=106335 RepID=A0A6A2ZBA6_HIBSY|nr:putative sodium/metabolite cotransporter BASS4 [Hibiscus syriacus]
MPTTLSSGVALTQACILLFIVYTNSLMSLALCLKKALIFYTQLAGGNTAIALAMTVVSNMLGILIIPFSISKFIADGVGVYVPTAQLLRSLLFTLLVPLILGRFYENLSEVPWMLVSRSRSLLMMVKPTAFIVAIGMGMLLHLVLLVFNTLAIKSLSAVSGGRKSVFSEKENAVAALLVPSQKTLPVMVAVVEQLGGAFGESGLLVLPCVAAHLIQIVFDSILVNFWLRRDLSSNTAKGLSYR